MRAQPHRHTRTRHASSGCWRVPAGLLRRRCPCARTSAIWVLAFVASWADLQRVPAAIYLSRCPHGMPLTPDAWLVQTLGHLVAFPSSFVVMAGFCIVRALARGAGAVAVAIALTGIAAMLLAMPPICEWSWAVTSHVDHAAREAAFLVISIALYAGADAAVHLMTAFPMTAVRVHRQWKTRFVGFGLLRRDQ